MSLGNDANDHGWRGTGRRDAKLAGYAGIMFFVWVVVAGIIFAGVLPLPTFRATAALHRAYYTDHGTAVVFHVWFSCLFWAASFLLFASGLLDALSRENPGSGMWRRLAMAGAILSVAFGGTGLIFETVAAVGADDLSDTLLLALGRMVVIVDSVLLYWGLAVFVAAASTALLPSRRTAGSLPWLGFGSALMMVIGALWPLTGDDRGPTAAMGLIGLAMLGLWVLLAGIALLTGRLSASDHGPDFQSGAPGP